MESVRQFAFGDSVRVTTGLDAGDIGRVVGRRSDEILVKFGAFEIRWIPEPWLQHASESLWMYRPMVVTQ